MIGGLACLLASAPLAPLWMARGEASLESLEPLPLGGYSQRNGALGQPGPRPLMARMLLLVQGEKKLVVAAVEQLTMPESLVEEVKAKMTQKAELFLAATHTHSAPDSQMLNSRMTFRVPGVAPFRQRELERVSTILARAVDSLLKAPRERVHTLAVESWPAAANRARRPGAQVDPTLWMLQVNGKDMVGIYSAHPTLASSEELTLSGDWPGAWMDGFSARRGPWVALTGAIGDASPVAEGATGVEKSRALVENLVNSRNKVGKRKRNLTLQLDVHSPTLALPAPEPHPNFASDNKIAPELAKIAVSRFAPPKVSLTLVNLGGWMVAGIPGEPTFGVAKRLRQTALARGWNSVAVVSHVNGWAGYMLEPDDYARGGYEATLHFFGPTLSVRLAEGMDRGLAGFKPGPALSGG